MEAVKSSDPTEVHHISGYRSVSERALWLKRDEDPRAREELISRYLPFARRLAGRYRNKWESVDDLTQVASLGLMNAVLRFDPSKGTPFMAFASPTIHGELKRYFRDRVWMIRVPRDLQEEILAVDHASAELSAELHREPTREEIDDRTNATPGTASRASAAKSTRITTSLDSALDDGQTQMERFGAEDPRFGAIDDSDELREAMSDLGPTESMVLRLRFVEDMTQSEIAERIGCSQMHISRVLRRSITNILETIEAA